MRYSMINLKFCRAYLLDHTVDVYDFVSIITTNTWFPALSFRWSVTVSPCSVAKARKNYVHPYKFLKNSVAYVKIAFSVSVSLPLPLIRSYRIEFYFSVAVSTRPRAAPTRKAGNWPASPLGQPSHWLIWRERQRRLQNGVTERQYGGGFTETVTEADTDERKCKAGNQHKLIKGSLKMIVCQWSDDSIFVKTLNTHEKIDKNVI